MRRMTLFIELTAYGCVTLGLIFGFVDLDATTLDEIGFAFLILTISSTLAGAILSFIQVLQLVWSIFQYIKELRAKKNQVQPIPLSDPQVPVVDTTPHREGGKFFEDNTMRISFISLQNNSPTIPKYSSEDDEMFAFLRNLSTAYFEKEAKDKQLLTNLRVWWNSNRSVLRTKDNNLNLKDQKRNTEESPHNLIIKDLN